MKYRSKTKYIIGVDEAGRGPLAGPVTVAAIMLPRRMRMPKSVLKVPLRDSKGLSLKQRETWFGYFKSHAKIFYAAANVSAHVIDAQGIQKATKIAVARTLEKLILRLAFTWRRSRQVGFLSEVLLDGLLYAPQHYKQKTIIRGDITVPIISAASIIAKVTRDRKMLRLHKKFPQYGLNQHKGYGTKAHIKTIKKYGLSELHRKSYCKNILYYL